MMTTTAPQSAPWLACLSVCVCVCGGACLPEGVELRLEAAAVQPVVPLALQLLPDDITIIIITTVIITVMVPPPAWALLAGQSLSQSGWCCYLCDGAGQQLLRLDLGHLPSVSQHTTRRRSPPPQSQARPSYIGQGACERRLPTYLPTYLHVPVGVPVEQQLLLDVGGQVAEHGAVVERQLLHHGLRRTTNSRKSPLSGSARPCLPACLAGGGGPLPSRCWALPRP